MAISIVQKAHNSSASAATSITVTLGSSVTPGNGVVVLAYGNFSINSVSGGSDTFTSAVANSTIGIFYVPASAGGYTSVTVTTGGAGGCAGFVYEVSPLASLEATNASAPATASPWSAGSVAGTHAAEFFVGMGICLSGTPTGPSSPWTNETVFTYVTTGSPIHALASSIVATSTGSQTYNGTSTASGNYAAVASFPFVPPSLPHSSLSLRQAVTRSAFY